MTRLVEGEFLPVERWSVLPPYPPSLLTLNTHKVRTLYHNIHNKKLSQIL